MNENNIENILSKYLNANALHEIIYLLTSNNIKLIITKPRKSKYGDFYPIKNGVPSISINNNLNHDSFLITLLHEIAHFEVWKKSKSLKNPHGNHWKHEFFKLLTHYIKLNCFSEKAIIAIKKSFKIRNKEIVYSKRTMYIGLNNEKFEDKFILKNIPKNSIFMDNKNNEYEIIEKRRTRFLCRNIKTKKLFLVHEFFKVNSYIEKII